VSCRRRALSPRAGSRLWLLALVSCLFPSLGVDFEECIHIDDYYFPQIPYYLKETLSQRHQQRQQRIEQASDNFLGTVKDWLGLSGQKDQPPDYYWFRFECDNSCPPLHKVKLRVSMEIFKGERAELTNPVIEEAIPRGHSTILVDPGLRVSSADGSAKLLLDWEVFVEGEGAPIAHAPELVHLDVLPRTRFPWDWTRPKAEGAAPVDSEFLLASLGVWAEDSHCRVVKAGDRVTEATVAEMVGRQRSGEPGDAADWASVWMEKAYARYLPAEPETELEPEPAAELAGEPAAEPAAEPGVPEAGGVAPVASGACTDVKDFPCVRDIRVPSGLLRELEDGGGSPPDALEAALLIGALSWRAFCPPDPTQAPQLLSQRKCQTHLVVLLAPQDGGSKIPYLVWWTGAGEWEAIDLERRDQDFAANARESRAALEGRFGPAIRAALEADGVDYQPGRDLVAIDLHAAMKDFEILPLGAQNPTCSEPGR
jgi:hypothetical protein